MMTLGVCVLVALSSTGDPGDAKSGPVGVDAVAQALTRARAALKNNAPEDADAALEEAKAAGATPGQLYALRGRIREHQGDHLGAVDAYEMTLAFTHDDAERNHAYCRAASLISGMNDKRKLSAFVDGCLNAEPLSEEAFRLPPQLLEPVVRGLGRETLARFVARYETLTADTPSAARDDLRAQLLLRRAHFATLDGARDTASALEEAALALASAPAAIHADLGTQAASAWQRDTSDTSSFWRAVRHLGRAAELDPTYEEEADLRLELLATRFARPTLIGASAVLLAAALFLSRRRKRESAAQTD